jgi:DnaJ-domain-containing protein 1
MESKETKTNPPSIPVKMRIANSYYGILGLHPSASVLEIRRSYRELSKLYHPDTTELAPTEATVKFQQLNEAYATLSNPERRSLYDLKIGYTRFPVTQGNLNLQNPPSNYQSNSAYLDPNDRPLSGGELFALLLMGVTFLGCILLVMIVALVRGETL